MDIIISGYGRMGKEVEKICKQRNHNIIAIIDNRDQWNTLSLTNTTAVIIDFSLPNSAIENISRAFELNIPIVTGTTGWYDKLESISELCSTNNGTLFYAPNFSIGVNIFSQVNKYLAKIMNGLYEYQVKIIETHHKHKIDSPSGTAISTANGILGMSNSLNSWSLNKEEPNSITIYSSREGEVTGKHEVVYESPVDIISLLHDAKNRSGFAIGAVMAAEFIKEKKGIFNMEDIMRSLE